MVRPVDSMAISSVLVGRALEIERLDLAIESVLASNGVTVVVSGEAGIGKTRLISETRERFNRRSTSTVPLLQGNCFEVDRNYPCAPLIGLLQQTVAYPRDRISAASELDPPAAAVRDPLSAYFPPPDVTDPAESKRRLLQSLRGAFSRITRQGQPVLIVIEDLHWSDEVTLELLPPLSRVFSELPILFLITYRDDELSPLLRHMLAALDRERLATELNLRQLKRRDIELMLRAIFKQTQPIRTDFLNMIHNLTDGNPFFIEEVVRALISAGDIFRRDGVWSRTEISNIQVPRSVQDAVWRRTRQLTPEAQKLLALVAVIGRTFSFSVLQQMTGQDEPVLLDRLRELVDNQLIHEESADMFTFRHALTREAVYTRLLLRERQLLHRSIAEVIERIGSGSSEYRMADLAYHYEAAGLWEKAFSCAVDAGDQALQLFAPRAAAEQFSHALRAADYLEMTGDPELYRKRGRAYTTLGEFELANHDFVAMLELVQSSGERHREWEALLELGRLWTGRDYDRSGEYFQQAYELARTVGDDRAEAMSLLQLGNWQVNLERLDEASESLTRALKWFEELHDQRGRAETLDLLGVVADASGDIAQMRIFYKQAADLYERLDDRKGVVSVEANVAVLAGAYSIFETFSLSGGVTADEAQATGERVIDLARELDWRSGEAYARFTLGLHLASQGNYDLALDCSRQSLEITREISHREWMAVGHILLGYLHSDLLDEERAVRTLTQGEAVASDSGSLWMHRLIRGCLASSLIDAGNLDEAGKLLHEIDDRLSMRTMGLRMLWLARARLSLAQGDAATGLEIIDRLFATAPNVTAPSDIPALAKRRAECLIALGHLDEALASLEYARSGAVMYGLRPLLWRVQICLGNLKRTMGLEQEATAEFADAQATIENLTATVADEPLREYFLSRAFAIIPAHQLPNNSLTPREREVAELVARGMSNREIADSLFIGERTVETHVGNILAKLGFTSRTQVAAWVIESGLENAPG